MKTRLNLVRCSWLTTCFPLLCCLPLLPLAVQAQLIPDNTLGKERSVINSLDDLSDLIEGGAIRQSNLFHSFLEFNIEEGRRVDFANPAGIANIFSRVTGGNPSEIFGQLGIRGDANLFLLNPNGILFGPNASLDVRGSFVATSAESILFENGLEFSATNPDAPPLLTLKVPIGLQYGRNPGSIVNRSQTTNDSGETVGLQVRSLRTPALLGGTVALDGGHLTTPEKHIEVGGVGENGLVRLTPSSQEGVTRGWILNYEGVENFRDIQLIREAGIRTSGEGGGRIQVQGDRVTFADGSIVLADTLGDRDGEGIAIRASQLVVRDGSQVSASADEESGVDTPRPEGAGIPISTIRLALPGRNQEE